MSAGVWLVYVDRLRRLELEQIADYVTSCDGVTAASIIDHVVIVTIHDDLTGNDAEIGVALDLGGHVALEARELVEFAPPADAGVPPPDLGALARADARYEITWDLERSDETFNPMMLLVGWLEESCGGTIFDATNGRFV